MYVQLLTFPMAIDGRAAIGWLDGNAHTLQGRITGEGVIQSALSAGFDRSPRHKWKARPVQAMTSEKTS